MAVPQNVPVLVEATSVQGPGMQVDAAVKWVLIVVEAPEILCRRTRAHARCYC
jgi:hypothetical protein